MTSNPNWGETTSGLEVAKVFADQVKGRNVLITGVSPDGVGSGTALAFASQNPSTLILASRTKSKMDQVVSEIHSHYPDVNVQIVLLDLASQSSIRKAASEVANLVSKLHLLINNAGVAPAVRKKTEEGIELQFGANHVGHFLLTKLLLPLLEAAASTEGNPKGSTRIVNLSSQAHWLSPFRFHDYNIENKEVPDEEKPAAPMPRVFAEVLDDGYMPTVAYAQSKTANVLFSVYLQKYLQGRGIEAFAVHPGGVTTNLGREQQDEYNQEILKTSNYWKNIDEGASATLVAALDPALNDADGVYLLDCQFAEAAPWATDPVAAEKLWRLSEDLIGDDFEID
ncbi:uncharacterized protein BCR38DRAFT_362395 [Pseudomassariella vexata]|uniref:Short-chain dehydrogenase n=1 Tax=Pseudomassariella vexata TaxID=1141098 RepID=A0A1Y2EGH1_9PEZI|nr:uncharacterized protein BCR38DRAFT_362395 [Pseudomassariella vexata]ORY70517.1 hypothetical protein BCR38DRAFT_362395 [Pseudomassariella vexata]